MRDRSGVVIPHTEDQKWAAALVGWLSGMTPHSRRSYLTAWVNFFEFADCTPDKVTSEMVNRWIAHLGALGQRPTTLDARRGAISSFFTYLVQNGLARSNPALHRAWLSRRPPRMEKMDGPITFGGMLKLASRTAAGAG